MKPELAGAVAAMVVRIAFVFAPSSFKGFGFNAAELHEAKEALNANATRIILVTWVPTTLAVSTAMTAGSSGGNISFLPFLAGVAFCVCVCLLVWRKVEVRVFAARRWTLGAPLVLSIADFVYFLALQEKVVSMFSPAPGGPSG